MSKKRSNKFYAACWHDMMRFLYDVISDGPEDSFEQATDILALMVSIERKMSE